jgi:tetratricopeptide (TPR) repeat protein
MPGVRHLHYAGEMIVAGHIANLSFTLLLLFIGALNPVIAQEEPQLSASEYTERGIACLRIDDFDGAIANFDKAIALNPSDAVNYFRRAATYMERGVDSRNKNDLNRAIADLNKAITIDPRNAVYYFSRGSVKLYQWKDREAELDFRKSLELDSKQKPEMDRVIGVIKKRRKAARMR